MRSIKKAVFPIAGLGTRLLPFTKAVPKEMMPIMGKPLIQHSVEEALDAGCKTLIFVTSDAKPAIRAHFEPNLELEKSLINSGKSDIANEISNILPSDVECIYVNQEEQLGLGHAVLCAEKAVGNHPFCVILPDDFQANVEGLLAHRAAGSNIVAPSSVSTGHSKEPETRRCI